MPIRDVAQVRELHGFRKIRGHAADCRHDVQMDTTCRAGLCQHEESRQHKLIAPQLLMAMPRMNSTTRVFSCIRSARRGSPQNRNEDVEALV